MKPFIFSLLLASIFCIEGVIIPQPDILTNETAKCFVDNDVSFLLALAYFESGWADDNVVNNLRTALAEGVRHVYPFVNPSLHKHHKDQVNAVVELLKGMNLEYIFIDINIRSWSDYKYQNIDFMKDLINGYTKAGYKVGIIASRMMWEFAFGSWQLGGTHPLIYRSLDGNRNFNDFKPFGGFKEPVGKYYTNKRFCGFLVQMIYAVNIIS